MTVFPIADSVMVETFNPIDLQEFEYDLPRNVLPLFALKYLKSGFIIRCRSVYKNIVISDHKMYIVHRTKTGVTTPRKYCSSSENRDIKKISGWYVLFQCLKVNSNGDLRSW